MRLAVQAGHAESLNHTRHSLSASHTDHINALRVLKDLGNLDLLLELGLSERNLVSNGSTVKLDFHNVSLVLSEAELADLGGTNDTHNRSVLLNASDVSLDGSLGLVVFLIAVGILGEGLLLGVHPVLVETSLHVLVQLLGPDGGESSHAAGGLNVTNHADHFHGRALNHRASVDNVLLDDLLAFTTFLVLDNVRHASLVAHKGSEVNLLGGVVTREGSNSTAMVSSSALGQESEGAAPGVLKLSVRHLFF